MTVLDHPARRRLPVVQRSYYERAKSSMLDSLWEAVYNCGCNPRKAEVALHILTNPIEELIEYSKHVKHVRVTWRMPLFAKWAAPRYLRSPEAAIKLVMQAALHTPLPLDTNDVARKALATVAKGDTIFWGFNASRHIAQAIIIEMLRQMEAMKKGTY